MTVVRLCAALLSADDALREIAEVWDPTTAREWDVYARLQDHALLP